MLHTSTASLPARLIASPRDRQRAGQHKHAIETSAVTAPSRRQHAPQAGGASRTTASWTHRNRIRGAHEGADVPGRRPVGRAAPNPSSAPAPPLCLTTSCGDPLMLFATPFSPALSSRPIQRVDRVPLPDQPEQRHQHDEHREQGEHRVVGERRGPVAPGCPDWNSETVRLSTRPTTRAGNLARVVGCAPASRHAPEVWRLRGLPHSILRLPSSLILRVSRGSTKGSRSAGMPASIWRPRSSSALNSAPSRTAMLEIP